MTFLPAVPVRSQGAERSGSGLLRTMFGSSGTPWGGSAGGRVGDVGCWVWPGCSCAHAFQDLPSFTQNVHRLVNDLRYYRLCNDSLPPGTVKL